METTVVVANPAGRRPDTAVRVAAELRSRGVPNRLLQPRTAGEVAPRIGEAVADGARRVVLVGGDGLLHAALPALAGAEVAVGLVPAGSGNDFARALGLPRRLTEAVTAALGDAAALDVIDVTCADGTDQPVASVATFGFSGAVTARAERFRRAPGGSRYTLGTFTELRRLAPVEARIVVDDEPWEGPLTLAAVGNTSCFGGGMRICPSADPTDGLLDVVTIAPVGRARLLWVFPRVFAGRHVADPRVSTLRGRDISVEVAAPADERSVLWGDGERIGPLPARLRTRPGSLLVAGVARGG